MIYNIMGDETTPVKKVTNKGGKTTLVQDPSNYYNSKNLNPQPTSSSKASSGSSGGSSGGGTTTGSSIVDIGGGGYVEPAFDWASYYAELMRAQQERADAAYRRNMERIASSYNAMAANLANNYKSTEGRLNEARNQSLSDVNADAEKSLREAYINNMLSKKNLNQRLSAMGYNGGATETTMANLENNYGNSRNNINTTLNSNINKLNSTYGDNLAAALQSYNSALNNLDMQRLQLEMQAEDRRQSADDSFYSSLGGLTSMDSSYLSALQSALKNQAAYTYDASKATNDFVAGQALQAQSAASGANYSKWLAKAQLDATQGKSMNQIKTELFNAVAANELDISSLDAILSQLRAA